MFICIGECPLVFLARIPSLAAVTICLIWLARKIVKRFSSNNSSYRRLRIFLVIAFLLLSGAASIVVNHILFSLLVNLIAGGGICTGLVHASLIEICIPSLGTLFVLTNAQNLRIVKFLHELSKMLFFLAITVSLYHSILENLILYDAWGLNLDWPYHGDYGTYLKYDERIANFGTGIVIYCSIVFSIVYNRLIRFLKPTAPIGRLFWFILGLFFSWLVPLFAYSQIFESLASYGFVFWITPGHVAGLIAPIIFIFSRFFVNKTNTSKIKAVKKKAEFSLEQIKIASPCPASWQEMLGDDKVRFCQICSKNVYNLSAMTRDEAQTLVMNNQGKLCGLLYLRKDGSVMTADCPIGFGKIRRRLIKRVAKVAGVAFALIGLQQFFIGDRSLKESNSWNETLVPSTREENVENIMGSLGYINE